MVGQVGGGFDHPPGVAGGTDTTALARSGDEKIVAALGASSARKAMRENAAFEIAAELPLDIRRTGSALPTVEGEFEPGGEVRLHGAIEHGAFGPATAIDSRASGRAGGRHGDSGRALEMRQRYTYATLKLCRSIGDSPPRTPGESSLASILLASTNELAADRRVIEAYLGLGQKH